MKKEITIKAVIVTKDNGIDDILGMDYISKFNTPKELWLDLWEKKRNDKINNFFILESEPLAGTCYYDYTTMELCGGGNFPHTKYMGIGADHEDFVIKTLNKETV